MKHNKLVEFLSNLKVTPPCTNVKPLLTTSWWHFCLRRKAVLSFLHCVTSNIIVLSLYWYESCPGADTGGDAGDEPPHQT